MCFVLFLMLVHFVTVINKDGQHYVSQWDILAESRKRFSESISIKSTIHFTNTRKAKLLH